jgi:hypothetical protein
MHNRPYPQAQPRRAPVALIVACVILALLVAAAVLAWLAWQWQQLDSALPGFTLALRAAVPLTLVSLLGWAGATGIIILWRRYGWRESIAASFAVDMMRAKMQPAPNATSFTYSPRNEEIATVPPAQLALPAPSLPAALDLAALNYQPTPNHILLGVDDIGQITVSIPDLCHVALLGSTGGGKSNLLRLLIPQLQAVGAKIILADPHFAPLDPENGDDWQPIADRLIHAPAISAAQIDQELSFMLDELARRLEKRNKGEKVGDPLFFCFDELPVIADLVKDAPGRLGKLLREGRKVKLLTMGASQSLLIKEIGGSSALRDQYRTGFYVGGDRKSASAILDMAERDIDDGPLGKGVVLLRSKSTQPARLVRVPMVSNEALYQLLSVAQIAPPATTTAPTDRLQMGFRPPTASAPTEALRSQNVAAPVVGCSPSQSGERARIVALYLDGKNIGEIVKIVYGDLKGSPYTAKRNEVEQVIREALATMARGAK